MIFPAWIPDDLALEVSPPAHVMKLSEVRSAENTLALSRVLFALIDPDDLRDIGVIWNTRFVGKPVPDSLIPRRYRPDANGTKCNVLVSDLAQLHRAPLPHRWFIAFHGDAPIMQWMSANDMTIALRRGLYPGWRRIEPSNLTHLDIVVRAAAGLPTIATWFNPARRADGSPASGHVVWVVATPPGKTGIYVTGAGRTCVDQCPIAQAFGSHVNEVEFYGYER